MLILPFWVVLALSDSTFKWHSFRGEGQVATTVNFHDTKDLIDEIEKALIEDLVTKYNSLYEENIKLKEQFKKS